nr:tripartite tricarboxylate transporter substrate binding protein [Pseudomonas sp.]
MNRRQFAISLAGLGLAMASGGLFAQEQYPSRPVTLINPFPPGSPVDVVARELAAKLSDRWGQSIIVDNRAGASGTLGASAVVRAKPDGYTLLLTSASTHAIGPAVRKHLPYDPVNDFTPLAFIGHGPVAIVVHPSVPVNSLDELVQLAKDKPDTITYASSGVGTILHLTGEVFSQRTGAQLMHVPYQGAVPAATDLLGGHVNMMFDSIANATPNIRAGKVKALAVIMPQRSPLLPDVPTAAELGYDGLTVPAWFGLFGPAGLPQNVVQTWEQAVQQVVGDSPEFQARLMELGILAEVKPSKEFAATIETDIAAMKDVVAKAGIELLE